MSFVSQMGLLWYTKSLEGSWKNAMHKFIPHPPSPKHTHLNTHMQYIHVNSYVVL